MDKDKQVMLLEGEQALVRVGVQMGLVDKVLEEYLIVPQLDEKTIAFFVKNFAFF